MYQAEHLDLITNVRDNFTDDLTRLSGLLETVGQQADALTPVRIRVVVHDRQLRQLQRRLAATQGMSAINVSSAGGGARNLPMLYQGSHTPTDSPLNIFRQSVSDFSDAVGDVTSTDAPMTSEGMFAVGAATLASAFHESMGVHSGTGGGTGDGGLADPTTLMPSEIEDLFGIPVSQMVQGRQLDPSALARGESSFTVAADHIEETLSSQALTRALDTDQLLGHMDGGAMFDIVDPRDDLLPQLAQLSPGELTRLFGTENLDGVFKSLGDSVDDTTAQVE